MIGANVIFVDCEAVAILNHTGVLQENVLGRYRSDFAKELSHTYIGGVKIKYVDDITKYKELELWPKK